CYRWEPRNEYKKIFLHIAIKIVLCTRKQHKTEQSIFSQKGFIIQKTFETKELNCSRPRPICAQQTSKEIKTRIDSKDSMHSKQVMKHANKTTQLGLIKIGDASDMQTNRLK